MLVAFWLGLLCRIPLPPLCQTVHLCNTRERSHYQCWHILEFLFFTAQILIDFQVQKAGEGFQGAGSPDTKRCVCLALEVTLQRYVKSNCTHSGTVSCHQRTAESTVLMVGPALGHGLNFEQAKAQQVHLYLNVYAMSLPKSTDKGGNFEVILGPGNFQKGVYCRSLDMIFLVLFSPCMNYVQ